MDWGGGSCVNLRADYFPAELETGRRLSESRQCAVILEKLEQAEPSAVKGGGKG